MMVPKDSFPRRLRTASAGVEAEQTIIDCIVPALFEDGPTEIHVSIQKVECFIKAIYGLESRGSDGHATGVDAEWTVTEEEPLSEEWG